MIRKAKDKGKPMRIGVNAGSLEKELVEKYGFPCPPAMVESVLRYLEIAESEHYHDIVVSLKSSDVPTACEAYRLYAKQANYPPTSESPRRASRLTPSSVGLRFGPAAARWHRRYDSHQFAGGSRSRGGGRF